MPTDLPTDTAAVIEDVCGALIGTKYQLEAMQTARAQGQHDPEADAALLATLITQLAEAATQFHTWYMANAGAQEEEHR